MIKALNCIHDIPGVLLGKGEDGFKRAQKTSFLCRMSRRKALLCNEVGETVYAD